MKRRTSRTSRKWMQSLKLKKGSFKSYMIKKYGSKALDKKGRLNLSLVRKETHSKNKRISRKARLALVFRRSRK